MDKCQKSWFWKIEKVKGMALDNKRRRKRRGSGQAQDDSENCEEIAR